MKIKNIMNYYYSIRKETLERKLDNINENLEDYNEDDTTLPEAFLGGSLDGLRRSIWINGVMVTAVTTATILLQCTGHKVDKKD